MIFCNLYKKRVYFILAMVFIHFVQTNNFLLSILFVCRLMFCRFNVLELEWDREAPLVALRPHRSHFLAI